MSTIPAWARDDDDDFDIPFEIEESPQVYTEFLTGSSGTGKSYEINRRISEDRSYALLCATTGIAAVNLGEGVTTINSALKYFKTENLEDAYINGRLTSRLRKIVSMGYRNIVIDEVSMMAAEQLDIIVRALDDLSSYKTIKHPLGLILTGDFCQLPPVKARWAFEADCWQRFEENTIRLTTYWRQSNTDFQAALLAMRQGDGPGSVDLLDMCGVEYASNNALDFNGTTIMGTNVEVDRFNWLCHSKLTGCKTVTQSIRWGRQLSEWKHIPERLELKIGAYVMILANAKENAYSEDFLYVNGDCGEVVDIDTASSTYLIRLKRSGRIVPVVAVTRCNEQKERPAEDIEAARLEGTIEPFYDGEKKRWVVGAITYLPLRLAYASTCHKVQGITLDAVQINLGHVFFGSPSMCYVALSRCREASGLRIVGNRELLAKRVCTDPKVRAFL